ncbi:hypothetical protein GCM10022230_03760 [Pseudoclavibacter caeni]|uniref:Heme A synthase n=2 Tax=Pseudoclavibacter caeni TaxID=908846 RepID=A0A7C8FRH0_9MICO|nr:heme A synthase [Pseudoclavibacter caeni]
MVDMHASVSSPAPRAPRDAAPAATAPAGQPPRPVRVAAIASLMANIGIVATGGLVRLTGSGLGCDTWPKCTPGSFTTTPAQGFHGLVEFGNRTLTGVLLIIAVWMLVAVYRRARERRDLVALAWVQIAGIIVQAVVGGMVVLFHLTWNLVGFHYLLSIALVAAMAILVARAHLPAGPRELVVARPVMILTHVMTLVLVVVVVLGVMATGSGPHSGDESRVLRTGIDAELVYHVHAWAAYTLFTLTAIMLVLALRTRGDGAARWRRWVGVLLAVQLVQMAVGIAQANLALPIGLVLVHMTLAALLTAASVAVVMALKAPVHADD